MTTSSSCSTSITSAKASTRSRPCSRRSPAISAIETGYLDQYQEATRNGGVVLAVGADQGEEADRAREIMELEGAMNIRYFGKLAVTDMTPPTNPSAPSDAKPQGPKHPEGG